jgi:signal transduction histidine kinase
MLSSLRTRLWLSYALVVGVLLVIVVAGLVLAFLQTPRLVYPEVVFRLRLFNETLPSDVQRTLNKEPERAERYLRREAADRKIRLVIIDPDRTVSIDTGGVDLPFARIVRADQLRPVDSGQVRTVRTREGKQLWLYLLRHLDDGSLLLVMSPAPVLPLAVLLSDRFFSAFLYGGLAALVLAFILAFLMANWISAPLRRMVGAAQAVARGEHAALPVEGPGEVQELARAMNEMSQRVQVSQQSQRDFVANVSHELKTPLTSIQGFAQAILDGAVQTPDALQQAAGVVFEEATRMHRLVLDLLSLARLEAGTADLERTPVNIVALLRSVIEKFTPQAQAAQVDLREDFQEMPLVIGDGDRLAQVFTNLVDNAIKFTPQGGTVTVASQPTDGWALVSVSDSGSGIAPEDQPRIFERFYQVDKSRRGGAGRGVGLGLSIARQIVLAHAGQIWVENQPGQGSSFMVKIPFARSDDATLTSRLKGER